jgi:isocitrate dehydrogenase
MFLYGSVLVSPNGWFEYEAAHGTVQKHYYKHQAGESTSTNSVALIFAWSGALRKRGELDEIGALTKFADDLEETVVETIERGYMTGDLARICEPKAVKVLNSFEFLDTIAGNLVARLNL